VIATVDVKGFAGDEAGSIVRKKGCGDAQVIDR
jgi:hypothetical protein